MDATTSTIFLKLVGHTDLLGDFVVYTAGNFRGGSGKIFELRNAYVSARGFTAGYDYGSFMDLGNVPATIDLAWLLTGCRSIMPHRSVTNMRSPKV